MATGGVEWKVYKHYFQAGGVALITFILLARAIASVFSILNIWWLSHWSDSASNATEPTSGGYCTHIVVQFTSDTHDGN